MDIWQTNEVYGDYLIEKEINKTRINYTRFGQRYKETILNTIDSNEIQQWVCKDA